MSELTAEKVQAGLKAGVAKAQEIGSPSSITVLDSGRNLVGFLRMDGALLASIEISQGKAYTSSSLKMKTADVTDAVQPGGPFYGMETSHRHPMVVFGGGVPIESGGAVGVAGGAIDDDVAVAEAVTAALSS